MNVDLYTKTILTVIAACLVWLCLNGVTPVASAQVPPPPTPMILVNEKGVPVVTAQGLRVNLGTQALPVMVANQALPVTIEQTLPVAITSVERRGVWQPLAVDVMRQPPTLMPTP